MDEPDIRLMDGGVREIGRMILFALFVNET